VALLSPLKVDDACCSILCGIYSLSPCEDLCCYNYICYCIFSVSLENLLGDTLSWSESCTSPMLNNFYN